MKKVFEKESKIISIGGKMQEDYLRFRNVVVFLNENILPLYISLGFDKKNQTDMVVEAILEGMGGAKKLFLNYWCARIKDREIPIEKVLPARTITKLKESDLSDEERNEKIDREIHRNLSFHYKKIETDYRKEYTPPLSVTYDELPIRFFKDSLILTPSGLTINIDAFIDLYGTYLSVCEGEAKLHHQAAAEAINRFFNGAVEITQKELMRYFIFEDGVIKPNLSSINKEGYMRLGYRLQGK